MSQFIPPLFVSQGSPGLSLAMGRAGNLLSAPGQALPRPRAILVASAHWDTNLPAVSTTEHPPAIPDCYGFPARPDTRPAWAGGCVDGLAARRAPADADGLLDYRRAAPHGARAHPTEDHQVPLSFARGAGGGGGHGLPAGATRGSLAMDAFVFEGRIG
jgi:aromatic ring-opening dioxygenase catalytic subunit (LigB family)